VSKKIENFHHSFLACAMFDQQQKKIEVLFILSSADSTFSV
jgi:hypothetical protein